ncbi:phosphopantetheine-binding protein [Nocardia goodfellowii]|uniref:Act minimal PKS acyl carrier protein n=1 Tax=Nocardia goodfellowii TaxID=882446 RepID=A0ABS4QJ63_9NOCA|nr:phosphopantetheine-binding protein [Nocardia goodfellowii]MBP2191150.1 act minimal PKS acyl carrier protein [Nocardia goodfellowii]
MPFTLEDLRRILREGSGDTGLLDGDIDELEFEELGYESLALLETTGRIKREFGVALDDEEAAAASTPRALVALVNAHLLGASQPG